MMPAVCACASGVTLASLACCLPDRLSLLVLCLASAKLCNIHSASTHLSLCRILYLRFARPACDDFCRPVASLHGLVSSKCNDLAFDDDVMILSNAAPPPCLQTFYITHAQPAALLPVQMLRFHRPLPSGLPHQLAGRNSRRRRPVRAVLVSISVPAAVRAGRAGTAAPARGAAGTGTECRGQIFALFDAHRAVAGGLARRPAVVLGLSVSGVVPFAQVGGIEVAHRSTPEGWRIRCHRCGHRRR